jgi:hypothetical protein
MLTLHNFSTHVFDTGTKGINIGYSNEGLSSNLDMEKQVFEDVRIPLFMG